MKIHLNECETETKKIMKDLFLYLSTMGHGLLLDVKCSESI